MGDEMLRAALDSSRINALITQYWRVSVVDVTASTQSDLAELVRQGKAIPGQVLAANFQSAGRGRMSRTFEAPKNSALLFSFYIEPKRAKDDWGWIPLIAGASVAKTLGDYHASIKWPNDILIKDKKVSGLIAEIVDHGVVVGVGINVGMKSEELPVTHATSLAVEGGQGFDRNSLLSKVLTEFYNLFTGWDSGDDSVRALYNSLSSTIGKNVRIKYANEQSETGVAVAISSRGELIMESGSYVQAGDIIHLR